MASGRKPVWLDENAHNIIKQYAKLAKTSMTEATSQLVLQHVEELEGGNPAAANAAPAPSNEKAAAPAPRASKTKVSKPVSNNRAPRTDEEGVRYLGGIWLV